jgi:hypothetical protein
MKTARAFTLFELVVVIGLVVLLGGGTALALRREGQTGISLRAGERDLMAALGLARRLAVARQTPVRLGILAEAAEGDEPGAIRRRWWIEVAVGSAWIRFGDPRELPPGICFVPTQVTAADLQAGTNWRDGLVSHLDGPVTLAPEGGTAWHVEFRGEGTVRGGPRVLVLAAAGSLPGRPPRLLDPAAHRTVRIMASGRIDGGDDR